MYYPCGFNLSNIVDYNFTCKNVTQDFDVRSVGFLRDIFYLSIISKNWHVKTRVMHIKEI